MEAAEASKAGKKKQRNTDPVRVKELQGIIEDQGKRLVELEEQLVVLRGLTVRQDVDVFPDSRQGSFQDVVPPPGQSDVTWENPTRVAQGGAKAGPLGSTRNRAFGKQFSHKHERAEHRDQVAEWESKPTFDRNALQSVYDKPLRKARRQGALVGGGVLGLLSLPFGPIGMAGGGFLGALVGGGVGHLMDERTAKAHLEDAKAEKRRLTCLIRWAIDRFHEDDEMMSIMETVILEFKPMADIAGKSKNARKVLRLLDSWIAHKSISRNLWVYMDTLLQEWRDLNRGDFMRAMQVFQTLTTMYQCTPRTLDAQEVQFIKRMERLLQHSSVQKVMSHAMLYPTQNETRVMACMVYADALGSSKKRVGPDGHARTPSGQNSPCPSRGGSVFDDEASEDSADLEQGVESYRKTPSKGTGFVMEPEATEPPPAERPVHMRKVPKKPFFKGWDDFMLFDLSLKHKMPIMLSEFTLLLEKEKESNVGWDVCVKRKEITVSKVQTGEGGVTLRAWATVPGVDMNVAFHLFHTITERVKWDKVFAKMHIVEGNVQGSDILYSLMNVPVVTDRDFLQYRRAWKREDAILFLMRSAEHVDAPEDKRYIRAESYISGYVFRQSFEGNTPVLNLFILSCSDIKGLVPKWLINHLAPKKPPEWVESLRKAALDYQSAHPGYKEKLIEEQKIYTEENPFDFELEPVLVDPNGDISEAPAAVSASGPSALAKPSPKAGKKYELEF